MSKTVRLAAFPALGLSLLAAAAGLATAGGGKPAKPPAGRPPVAPPAAAPADPASAKTLEEIVAAFDAKETEARKGLRGQRIDVIVAYLAKNPAAKDAEAARKALVDLAEELEDWTRTVSFADEFAKAHAASDSSVEVRLSKAQALAALGRDDEAKPVFAGLVKDLDLSKHAGGMVGTALYSYADLLLSAGDVAGAKKVWEDAKEAIPQAGQFADQQLLLLELIGKEPTAMPESARDLEGKPVTLADYKDKVVLIDFWATWCGPCKAEIPHVVAVYEKYKDKGFDVLGISLDVKGSGDDLRAFLKDKKMPWRQVYYPDLERPFEQPVAQEYNVNGIPHTVLVGRDGKVLRVGLRGAALEKTLAKVMAEKPAGAAPGK